MESFLVKDSIMIIQKENLNFFCQIVNNRKYKEKLIKSKNEKVFYFMRIWLFVVAFFAILSN
jgi:hypothetical protein